MLFAGAGVLGRWWYSRVHLLQEVSPLETEFHVVVGSPSNKMSVMDLQVNATTGEDITVMPSP